MESKNFAVQNIILWSRSNDPNHTVQVAERPHVVPTTEEAEHFLEALARGEGPPRPLFATFCSDPVSHYSPSPGRTRLAFRFVILPESDIPFVLSRCEQALAEWKTGPLLDR